MIPELTTYKNAVSITSQNEIKPGLNAIQEAMIKLGSPEKNLRAIHVAGTNGKGSTSAFMENMLLEAGYTTGVFSSPAIIDIHDQIRINGSNIAKEKLVASFQELKDKGLDGKLTDFELLTAAAIVAFARAQPDVVIIECGMGGRFDSTNIITPIVAVITSIAEDHTAFLGESISSIAWHKAGILKNGVPAVVGDLAPDALEVVLNVANETNSPLFQYGSNFVMNKEDLEVFEGARKIGDIILSMKGPHQRVNAAVAIQTLLLFNSEFSSEAIRKGIGRTQLAFRFEEVMPNVFFDGAHNPAAAKKLCQTIQQQFPEAKVEFLIGMMKGKDISSTLVELMPVANSFHFIDIGIDGAASAETLYNNCSFNNKDIIDLDETFKILTNDLEKKKIVSGSLYLLSSLKSHILDLPNK